MFVRDIMNQCATVCTEEMTLENVYKLMQDNKCDHIIVVENYAHQSPIGIITESDICYQVVGRGRNPRSLTAANVMNTNVTRAFTTLTLADCALLMEETMTSMAFVVDENGTLNGTVRDIDIQVSKDRQHIEDLASMVVTREYRPSVENRIF